LWDKTVGDEQGRKEGTGRERTGERKGKKARLRKGQGKGQKGEKERGRRGSFPCLALLTKS